MHTTAGRTGRPPFDPQAVYVTARDLKWGTPAEDIKIPAGALFDLARLGCDEWTAKRLYRTRFIAMVLDGGPPTEPVPQPPAVEPPPAPPAPEPSEPGWPEPSEIEWPEPSEPGWPEYPEVVEPAPMLAVASGLKIVSRGFARFIVVDGNGNQVSPEGKWLTKKEAEAIATA